MPVKNKPPLPNNPCLREHLIPLSLLLLLALSLRLVSFYNEPLINPDGIAYILQAKAFYLHQTEQFLSVYPYPTNLALMIAALYVKAFGLLFFPITLFDGIVKSFSGTTSRDRHYFVAT